MTMVLVHGGTATRRCWRALDPLLEVEALAVDLPGRGDRPADHAAISLDGNARDVLAQMDAAGIDRAHLVGHSLGGATILAIALHASQRVRSLVFLAAPVPEDGGTIFSAVGEAAQAFIGHHRDHGDASVPAPPTGGGALGTEPAVAEAVAPFFAAVPTRGAAAVPAVHYIRTSEDAALAPPLQDRAIAHLRGFAAVSVHDLAADHMVMLTRPPLLADVLNGIAA